jgi:hypothetical protein
MQDLINKLKAEGGLTDEQAVKVINIIKNHIMSMLPPMMQPMVENFMGATNNDSSDFLDKQ